MNFRKLDTTTENVTGMVVIRNSLSSVQNVTSARKPHFLPIKDVS
jgi:hypothetical protein